MKNVEIQGKTIGDWEKEYPILSDLISTKEVFWTNPSYKPSQSTTQQLPLGENDVKDAEDRLKRFAPYIAKVFPETQEKNGIIESRITHIPKMQEKLEQIYDQKLSGSLLLKMDSHLPISGSIKARGGIYEVLKHAEDLALKHQLLSKEDDYSVLDNEKFRNFFSQHSIVVGSTGNLGLSIGIMSSKLGFKVTVHMSADAKQWKKDLLRSKGVTVIEHEEDYTKAVEEGRKQAEKLSNCYSIDNENSKNLFLGYAVAASRLKQQLEDLSVKVDQDHPLFVYLPCGVGGGPGGVTFGLKLTFQSNVHCFFAEPTHSPCMLLGMMTGLYDKVAVQDFGIDNITAADGLAVGKPSGFIGKMMDSLLSGCYTISDSEMYRLLRNLADTEGIYLEPSALAGMIGPILLLKSKEGQIYVDSHNLADKMGNGTHIVWATGGSMVPKEIIEEYYKGEIIEAPVFHAEDNKSK